MRQLDRVELSWTANPKVDAQQRHRRSSIKLVCSVKCGVAEWVAPLSSVWFLADLYYLILVTMRQVEDLERLRELFKNEDWNCVGSPHVMHGDQRRLGRFTWILWPFATCEEAVLRAPATAKARNHKKPSELESKLFSISCKVMASLDATGSS